MGCEAFEQLEKDWKSAISEYSYFAYRENEALRQMSDRQSKQHARTAKEKMADPSRQMVSHQQNCAECHPAQQ